jgi:CRP-like cAMP-binding protein
MVAKHKDVFGAWALFDDEPRVATATTLEDTRLLQIDKEDFIDLLADHVEITQSILKVMVRRLRKLMARSKI